MWQVSYLWEEIPWLQQCLNPSQSSCSCTLQTRLKMLQAVSQLQVSQVNLNELKMKNCGTNRQKIPDHYYLMYFLRVCWGPRTSVRCILNQSKINTVTPCWCF